MWINADQNEGYGSLVAVRVFNTEQGELLPGFKLGRHRIIPNEWQTLTRQHRDRFEFMQSLPSPTDIVTTRQSI
jgi:hypothetical protein